MVEEADKIIESMTTCLEEHELIYDSTSETLEPVYFWTVDFMNKIFGGKDDKVEKIVDNFSSSVGSGHFAEIGARATRMQEEAMKILGTVNTIIKSVVNIIYDLKEFEIRIDQYGKMKSKDKVVRDSGLLGLKQIWMDNVDIKRGRGSINAMSQDLQFVTLRDAFMYVDSVKAVDELDLNDRVKRILKPRVSEFLEWVEKSEKEIRKRFEIEKTYLKSQVNSLNLYSRWAKPYLKAAAELEKQEYGRKPDLVNMFNTMYMELVLLGKSKFDLQNAIVSKKIVSQEFKGKKLKRDYYSCVLVKFFFRGIPYKVGQHYVFGGRATVKFKGYSLNEDELKLLDKKLAESDLNDALKLVEGSTEESIGQLKEDIDKYLKGEEKVKEEATKGEEDVNPFSALFGFMKFKKKEDEKLKTEDKIKEIKDIRKDNFLESVAREIAGNDAKENCFKVFDTYKKGHGMPSHPDPFTYWIQGTGKSEKRL